MSDSQTDLRAYRRLASALRELPRLTAPVELSERVLAESARFGLLPTDLGPLYVAYGARGIRLVALADSPEAFAETYRGRFGALPEAEQSLPARLGRDVARALAGDRRAAARLPLDLERLGSFEQAVLLKAREIPRGEVRTYGWVAREIGQPRASQAVGRALGHNPIPFIIPCHRVVGSNGSLTGYAFGLPVKERILKLEGVDPAELAAAAQRGERFRGSRSTRTFCLPTCRHARRIAPPNVVPFRDETQAVAAGYRPCRVCRPVAVGA